MDRPLLKTPDSSKSTTSTCGNTRMVLTTRQCPAPSLQTRCCPPQLVCRSGPLSRRQNHTCVAARARCRLARIWRLLQRTGQYVIDVARCEPVYNVHVRQHTYGLDDATVARIYKQDAVRPN